MEKQAPDNPSSSSTLIVDDDSAQLVYSPSWTISGSTHSSDTPESTVIFVFAGTSVRVLGTVGPTSPRRGAASSTYQVDHHPPIHYTAPIVSDSPLYNETFYSHSSLANGVHTLVITYKGGSSYYLDWIETANVNSSAPPVSAGETLPCSNTFHDSSPELMVLGTQRQHRRAMIGVIVGSVAGAVVLLLCIVLVVLFYRRRTRRATAQPPIISTEDIAPHSPNRSTRLLPPRLLSPHRPNLLSIPGQVSFARTETNDSIIGTGTHLQELPYIHSLNPTSRSAPGASAYEDDNLGVATVAVDVIPPSPIEYLGPPPQYTS